MIMIEYPGTVDIPVLRGVFYGNPEVEVRHILEAPSGYRGQARTLVDLRGRVKDTRFLDRLTNTVRGSIDGQSFIFMLDGADLGRGGDYGLCIQDQLIPEVTLRFHAFYEPPVAHPVVELRKRWQGRLRAVR